MHPKTVAYRWFLERHRCRFPARRAGRRSSWWMRTRSWPCVRQVVAYCGCPIRFDLRLRSPLSKEPDLAPSAGENHAGSGFRFEESDLAPRRQTMPAQASMEDRPRASPPPKPWPRLQGWSDAVHFLVEKRVCERWDSAAFLTLVKARPVRTPGPATRSVPPRIRRKTRRRSVSRAACPSFQQFSRSISV